MYLEGTSVHVQLYSVLGTYTSMPETVYLEKMTTSRAAASISLRPAGTTEQDALQRPT